jgi:hypothetical protein
MSSNGRYTCTVHISLSRLYVHVCQATQSPFSFDLADRMTDMSIDVHVKRR